MWLTKFLDITSRLFPSDPLADLGEVVSRLNPDKIYIENVRAILGTSHNKAVKICETAVQQGLFNRGIEVLCPDGSVATSVRIEDELPPEVNCWIEVDGQFEEKTIPTSSLDKITFYQLSSNAPSALIHR